jgi:hypothetical protein
MTHFDLRRFRFDRYFWSASLTCLLLSYFMGTLTVQADKSSYMITPVKMDLTVSEKTLSTSSVMKALNVSKLPLKLKIIPRLWTLSEQGMIEYLTPPTEGFNLLNAVRFNPEEFELAPNQSRSVRFVVKLPPETPDGEYPLQFYFEPTELLEQAAAAKHKYGAINVIPVFTATVYINKGKIKPQMSVKDFQCDWLPNFGGIKANISLQNQGLRHARLKGSYLLVNLQETNKKTRILAESKVKGGALVIVFPNKSRTFQDATLTKENLSTLGAGQYGLELNFTDERGEIPGLTQTCSLPVKS